MCFFLKPILKKNWEKSSKFSHLKPEIFAGKLLRKYRYIAAGNFSVSFGLFLSICTNKPQVTACSVQVLRPHLHSKVRWLWPFSTGPGTCQEMRGSASARWHQQSPGGPETVPSPCLRDQTDLRQHTSDKPPEATTLNLEDTQKTMLNSTCEHDYIHLSGSAVGSVIGPSSHADLPVFCTLQVFVKCVSGGTDSPSPIVTSLTKDMHGALMLGLSKS